jgi:oligopeptide transport system substrate-binding protein
LQSYLDETGQTADQLDLTLMFNTSSGHQKIAEAIQQMWKDNLGVDVKLVNQEWAVYLDTVDNDPPQIWRLGWCQDYPDANNFDAEVFLPNGSANATDASGNPVGGVKWNDPAFNDLVTQAATETDPAKRLDLYAQAEEILVKTDAVMIPIYWYTSVGVTKPYIQRTYGVGSKQAFEKWDILPH